MLRRVTYVITADHHDRLGSNGYFELLFDDGKFREIAPKMTSADPLEFQDTKAYTDRLVAATEENGPRVMPCGLPRVIWMEFLW